MWILAQKFGIPKIQFTDHMTLKKKEDQNVDASVLLRRGTKYSQEKIWYINTMEYYSAIKNDEFMNFLGKWMELENIILGEITQSKENTWYALTDKWILAQKLQILKIQFTDHMKLKK